MNDQERDRILSKMLESPQSLTAKEIKAINDDKELREIHDIAMRVRWAYRPDSPWINVDSEWERFHDKHIKSQHIELRRWIWAAAAVAVAVVLSAVALRFAQGSIEDSSTDLRAGKDQRHDAIVITEDTTKILNNTPFNQATDQLAVVDQKPYLHPVQKQNVDTTTTKKIDIDEIMRIEQARIDNEIAVDIANVQAAQYQLLEYGDNRQSSIVVLQ